MLLPGKPAPDLTVDTLAHGRFDVADHGGREGVVIHVYRGLHCPICTGYLGRFESHVGAFAERGYETLAVSVDGEDRAREMAGKAKVDALRVGYGLSIETAREWGLFVSSSVGKTSAGVEEPRLFAEPGLFIVKADRTLYFASVQSMPFARPHFDEVLGAIDFTTEKNYPPRGDVAAAA